MALDDSTAGWRASGRRCAWRGGVAARKDATDACLCGEVPRGRPGGAGALSWVHLAADEVHRRRTAGGGRNRAAERREMEVRAYLRFLKVQGPLGKLKLSPT